MAIPVTPATDVFDAIRWLNDNCTGRARAVSSDELEWECSTWGSGRWSGFIEDWGIFRLIAARFNLVTYTSREERDELVVRIPMGRFDDVARLVDDITDLCENWPWAYEEDSDHRLHLAAKSLSMTVQEIRDNTELLDLVESV